MYKMYKKIIVGGGSSLCEAMENMKNREISITSSLKHCEYILINSAMNESDECDELKKYLFDGSSGGTIVFSTDVNSKKLSDSNFKNKLLQIYNTYKNRLTAGKILDKLRRRKNIYAWTIGKYLKGVYTGDNGKTFNENSISIDVIGVSKNELKDICQELCKLFNQESVLLKDNATGQIYFIRED